MRLIKIAGLLSLMALLCPISPAYAQLPPGLPIPPENYAVPHLWGSPSVTSIEHFSMGGAYAADQSSDWHGNPAGLLSVTHPQVLAYAMSSGFDALPTFRANFLGYAQPLGQRAAMKLS